MRQLDIYVTPTQFKFTQDDQPGVFEGYGAVFGNVDSHGDVILPGAFKASLAEYKSRGAMPGLYAEHSYYEQGGDPLPVGVWLDMGEDDRGLKVKGKLSALDTDHGKRLRGLMHDGAMTGLSIAYGVPPGGSKLGKKAGEPKRTLKILNLRSVDIVRDPSNEIARIQEIKRAFGGHLKATAGDLESDAEGETNIDEAVEALTAAIVMQDRIMGGGYYGDVKTCALLMDSLRDAYEALTGERVPDGLTGWTKSAMQIREIEKMLREEFKLTRTQAIGVAGRWFKTSPRDEGTNPAINPDTKTALAGLVSSLQS